LIFQENYDKNQGHSRTNLVKRTNFKDFQGHAFCPLKAVSILTKGEKGNTYN